jgi:hypothetical protein
MILLRSMQDLIAKIEKLRKNLAAMKPKNAASSLVPALTPPTIKPLSISSGASMSTAPKMPGVTPASNKDPKKMAEQLKNPRPKKPRIDMLKTDERHYRIHVDGNPVTEPMPLSHIVERHGSVKHIESDPRNKIVPVGIPKMPSVAKNGQWNFDKSDEDKIGVATNVQHLKGKGTEYLVDSKQNVRAKFHEGNLERPESVPNTEESTVPIMSKFGENNSV